MEFLKKVIDKGIDNSFKFIKTTWPKTPSNIITPEIDNDTLFVDQRLKKFHAEKLKAQEINNQHNNINNQQSNSNNNQQNNSTNFESLTDKF